jgi:hypothetical protein
MICIKNKVVNYMATKPTQEYRSKVNKSMGIALQRVNRG